MNKIDRIKKIIKNRKSKDALKGLKSRMIENADTIPSYLENEPAIDIITSKKKIGKDHCSGVITDENQWERDFDLVRFIPGWSREKKVKECKKWRKNKSSCCGSSHHNIPCIETYVRSFDKRRDIYMNNLVGKVIYMRPGREKQWD